MEGGDDPDNRRDFPGGFPGDKHNAFLSSGRTKEQQRMWEWTRDWISMRREHTALRHGQLIDLYYDDDIYAYARQDERETIVIVINRGKSEKKIPISATASGMRNGQRLEPLYGVQTGKVVVNGAVNLDAPAAMVAAYKLR
jgi:glycosidase